MSTMVYIATSIDGYIAKKDGSIDWLMDVPNHAGDDFGYSEFIKKIDGIILGRKTFETVLKFEEWPYRKMVFVLSTTLKHIPNNLSDSVSIVSGELNSIVNNLKSRGFVNLYIDGGKTIQSFLRQDMIDELIITRIPLILGSGIPLFAESGMELKFEHIQTDVYANALVKSVYRRTR